MTTMTTMKMISRESKDMVWQEERMTLGEVMMTNSERWQAPSPLTA